MSQDSSTLTFWETCRSCSADSRCASVSEAETADGESTAWIGTKVPTSTRPVIILTLLSSPQPAHHLSGLLCTLRTLDALRVQWQLAGTAHVRGRHCAEEHGEFCDTSLVNFRRDGVSSCGANTVRAALPGHVSKSFRTGPQRAVTRRLLRSFFFLRPRVFRRITRVSVTSALRASSPIPRWFLDAKRG